MGPDEAAARLAERLKNDGNEYYRKDRLGAVIDAYTEWRCTGPTLPFVIGGGSIDWRRVEEDCRKALELDHDSVKGHYMLGLALLQKEEYSEGVKELERDCDAFVAPISLVTSPTWHLVIFTCSLSGDGSGEGCTSQELHYRRDMARTSESKIFAVGAGFYKAFLGTSEFELALKEKLSLDNSEKEGFLDDMTCSRSEKLEALGRVFRKAGEADILSEVPDYLCCKITLDIFRDPVITPSGLTYERATLLE